MQRKQIWNYETKDPQTIKHSTTCTRYLQFEGVMQKLQTNTFKEDYSDIGSQVYMSHMHCEHYSHSNYVMAFLLHLANDSMCIVNTYYLLL